MTSLQLCIGIAAADVCGVHLLQTTLLERVK